MPFDESTDSVCAAAALAELAELRRRCERLGDENRSIVEWNQSIARELSVYRFLDPYRLGRRLRPWLFELRQHEPRPMRIPARYRHVRPPKTAPTISIVTPSYNHADYLERTLRSVLDQHYPRLEYFVQDGGSTDDSASIIARYDGQLAGWESAQDGGQSNAINRGLDRSTGDILAYLNSDDLLMPGSLAYVANLFANRPDIDVLYGHRYVIDVDDREVGSWLLPPHDDKLLPWINFVPQETLFWRRRIWEKVGSKVDESFDYAMDWDLLLRFQAAGAKMIRAPRFLGAFRVYPSQKTSALFAKVGLPEIERLQQRYLGFVPSNSQRDERIRSYLIRHVAVRLLYRLGILQF